MEHNQVIVEINYYKAQAITELLYARGMITFDEVRQPILPQYHGLP